MHKTYIVLDNIRSVHNVGSIFRTADAAGVSKIYLAGVTPAPMDRFGRKRRDVAKVALGAEETVPWQQVPDTVSIIRHLQEGGVRVVAVEQNSRSVHYREYRPEYPVAFVFGSEVDGLAQSAVDASDVVIEIPMRGTKESLNVAVTAGIILFSF